jgi:hypothetical protein
MNRPRTGAAVLAAICLLAPDARAAGTTFADQIQACAFHHPLTEIARLADLPAAVHAALARQGGMADKGEPFNASDVFAMDPGGKTPGLPHTRFLRAGQWQDLVYVWYEAGGIALFHRLALYRLHADGTAEQLSDEMSGSRDPCTLTDTALDAHKPS